MERLEALAVDIRHELPVWLLALAAVGAVAFVLACATWLGTFDGLSGLDIGSWRWRQLRVI